MQNQKTMQQQLNIEEGATWKRRLTVAAVVSFSVVLFSGPVLAERLDDTVFENIVQQNVEQDGSLQNLNEDIEARSRQVKDIEERISIYKENLEKTQKERFNLENEVKAIQNRIDAAKAEIGKNSVQLEIYKLEVEALEKEISLSENDIERQKGLLVDLVRQLYLAQQRSPIEALFSSTSLSGLYDEVEYTQKLQENMQKTVEQVQDNKKSMETKQGEISGKKVEIAKETAQLQDQEQQLEGQQEFKDQLLVQTAQSEEQFQQLVEQTKQEQAQIESEIASLQGSAQQKILQIREQIRARLNDADPDNDEISEEEQQLLDGKLQFQWPISSRRVTCGFHCPGYPFQNYIGPHSGLDIATPMGSPIHATAGGYVARVVFNPSSTSLGWVMIVHGDGLASVYMHMSGVNVRAEQVVHQGDIIGRSGGMPGTPGSGLSTGPHLHFEMRLNGIPTNPMNYIQ